MLSKSKPIVFLVVVCIFSSLCVGCGEYEILELEKKARRSADSLYRIHLDSLKLEADSLCTLHYDKYYKRAFDSLKTIQLDKYDALIKK